VSAASPASSRDWSFGPIPRDWRALPLKYLCSRSSVYGANIAADAYENDGVRFLRTTDIRDDGALNEGGVYVPAEIVADYMLSEGDVLISRSGTVGRAYVYRPADGHCAYAGYLVRYALRNPETAQWLFYITKSPGFHQWLGAVAIEATIGNVNGEKYANLLIPVPPVSQQRAIADYLDRETARLDALVAAKERVLGLLAEKRRALVTRAVTRGLDPHAPLRDPGIPWLGEIPAHWETRRAAWLFRERDQRGEADLPLLEVSINAGVVLREFSDERIESTAADFNTYKVARQGDVAFNKMRMWQGAVGVALQDGLVSPDYVVAEPTGEFSSAYAGLLFRTQMFSAECARRSHGIVWDRLRLYWEGFREIELPLPSAEAQREIVRHIARETTKLDAVRQATDRSVALLKERRAALIAAAVTGQINVESAA
jgi:type I restriction enzyme S subunit